jgi:hypothetical protein
VVRPIACRPAENDQLSRITHWQGLEHDRIYQTEDRCVRADSEGQGEDSNYGEGGRLAKHSDSETHVLNERFERIHSEFFAAFLFQSLIATELNACAPLSFGSRQPQLFEVHRTLVDVRAKFFIHV